MDSLKSSVERNQPIAHVCWDEQTEKWKEHFLEDHLLKVAKLASKFAEDFGSSDWAYLAGLWHDLGKYRPAFQNYIRSVSGYDPEAHIEQGQGRVDHSTAGAIYSDQQLGEHGKILAYLIAGHHAGLADWNTSESGGSALSVRLEEGKRKNYLDESLSNNIPQKILNAELPKNFEKEDQAKAFLEKCLHAIFTMKNLEVKPAKKSPAAPFTTSTLQQEASRKLGFSVLQTMTVAQKLYESGKISYMRTDSTNLSEVAIEKATIQIGNAYGEKYIKLRHYKTKNDSAQEAHEAIRPTDFGRDKVQGDRN